MKTMKDGQALLKAKYCPWVAAITSTGSNEEAPSYRMTFCESMLTSSNSIMHARNTQKTKPA